MMLLWVNERGKGEDGAAGYKVDSIEDAVKKFIKMFPYDNIVGYVADDKSHDKRTIFVSKNKFKRMVRKEYGGEFYCDIVL